ncbi:MAG: UDP-N-acetylmuramoyl-L-alanine--D-glutamate ligase [Lachnospiraceae bacterium]|jgi:UDP-N-acetylmuramoylalanine--D-glutamate ligase|nr:UDP-N-acetylmuramoyl-L-alanine--D-glutamate ligase [Lachnospiraceae bacterium]MCI9588956.1 UDP-N-acetylmuramoyl-L-alanine--D-glutamate ligase [Lachnospiraceae bacterium]MDE6929854.1 UDP-N-acetylmuramoyl-L-alanine--D-glutamate ligase [Lachnospiraceae bacterium]
MSHGQKVIVAGTGISGIAATRLLLDMGGEVVLYDGNANQNREKVLAAFEDKSRVTLVLGELKRTDLVGVELCIVSPGVPMDSPFAATIIDAKIPIWGEIQLAYHCAKGRLAAITGTNGKTTTTALTGEIMKAFYESVFIVGNIGIPYTQVALDTEDTSVTVAEISSFQLETIMDFRPNVSAILNITPDHLNRHKTMENYIEIKKGITLNQTGSDSVVLNYDDPVLREFGQDEEQKPKARVLFFSSREKLKEGFYLDRDNIMYSHNGRETLLINVHDMNLLGRHNYENVMAAAAVSLEMGVPMETIRRVIRRFQAVEHRIEFVLERSGVKYYNDSKGTNPDAAIQAVKAMPGPTLLIAGGYDKGSEYDEWIESFGEKVKYLVLIGQTRDKIAECAKAHGFTEIMYAEDMSEAVQVCASYANMGDNVLLSPACASWGMFKNYEERGRVFKECVRNL